MFFSDAGVYSPCNTANLDEFINHHAFEKAQVLKATVEAERESKQKGLKSPDGPFDTMLRGLMNYTNHDDLIVRISYLYNRIDIDESGSVTLDEINHGMRKIAPHAQDRHLEVYNVPHRFFVKGQELTLHELLEAICGIYVEKMKFDVVDDTAGERRTPIPEFIREFLICKHGLKSVGLSNLHSLVKVVFSSHSFHASRSMAAAFGLVIWLK